MDKNAFSMLLKVIKPFIGGKLPTVEVVCPDKDKHGITVNGNFMSFRKLEQELKSINE